MLHTSDEVDIIDICTILFEIRIGVKACMRGDSGEYYLDEHKNHDMVHHDRKGVLTEITHDAVLPGNGRQQSGDAEPEGNT